MNNYRYHNPLDYKQEIPKQQNIPIKMQEKPTYVFLLHLDKPQGNFL